MIRDTIEQVIIIPAGTAATFQSQAKEMQSFWHVAIEVLPVAFTGTITFVSSDAETQPDFTAAASATNPYDTVQVKLLADNSSVNGATGLAIAGTSAPIRAEFNSNTGRWFGAKVSAYTSGSVGVKFKGYGT